MEKREKRRSGDAPFRRRREKIVCVTKALLLPFFSF
jgi:hypothetical protein